MDENIGFVGEISGMNTAPLHAAIEADCLPVLLPLAESASGQILNVNADVVAREAAIRMSPLKTVFINSKGGWVTTKQDEPHAPAGQKLARISMAEHYEEMAARDYEGRQGTLLKLNELKLILDPLPPPADPTPHPAPPSPPLAAASPRSAPPPASAARGRRCRCSRRRRARRRR